MDNSTNDDERYPSGIIQSVIKVVIGDFTENICQNICDVLSEDADGRFKFEADVSLRSDKLIELVETRKYDFALLYLNNMIFNPHEENVLQRIERGVELVSMLHHEYGLPVIALYGSPRDDRLAERIMASGAIFSSLTPCDWQSIESAFLQCMVAPGRPGQISKPSASS